MALDGVDTHHTVEGAELEASEVTHPLVGSLLRFVESHGGRELALDGIRRIGNSIEAILITMQTGAPQAPFYEIDPEESLVILFEEGVGPTVIPLRRDFPRAPHSYGLPMDVPISAPMVMCIDDRPWSDAQGDYTGAEIVRRIASWFRRAGGGQMNDDLQFVEPAFLPSPQTIAMPGVLYKKIMEAEKASIYLALTSSISNPKILVAKEYDAAETPEKGKSWIRYVTMPIGISIDDKNGMYRPPLSLSQLVQGLEGPSPNLLEQVRDHVQRLLQAQVGDDLSNFYESRLLISIVIDNKAAVRCETMCLIPEATIGEMGVALGLLYPPEGDVKEFLVRFPKGELKEDELKKVSLVPTNLCQAFDRDAAPLWSGRPAPEGRAVALGAGAIGSQVLNHLVREGAFSRLCVVDDDHLQPHNLARHLLRSDRVGHPKATEVSAELASTRPDLETSHIEEKFNTAALSPELNAELTNADIILDLTASVGASRQLSDRSDRGRAGCAFFNPTGDAVVVMVEDIKRQCDLANLEALYYREIVARAELHEHLRPPNHAVISSGQCRSTTSRIPSSNAAILSGLAARELSASLLTEGPSLSISTLRKDGSVSAADLKLKDHVISKEIEGWTVRVSSSVVACLRMLRSEASPDETGGVLLGIADHARRRLEIALALPAPADSFGSSSGFERGILQLREEIEAASSAVMHQITYLGEWHSHPDGARAVPSPTDRVQLNALAAEMASEERPAIMLIIAEDDVGLFSLEPPYP